MIKEEEMIYLSPDEVESVKLLSKAYDDTQAELGDFFGQCAQSYNDRRNLWAGKSVDMRKHGANAFPWEGASDQEVNVIGERIDDLVGVFSMALARSHVKAFPSSASSLPRAAVVSSFLKWMKTSYIPNFSEQMELGANYLLEKGLMITHVGWQREERTFLQTMSLEEIGAQSPELVQMIQSGDVDNQLIELLKGAYPSLTDKRGKMALRDLRNKGVAELPVSRKSVDRPTVHACSPDSEVFFPSWVTDPQRSPYVFFKTYLTAQELEKKATSDGWDEDWVSYAIENLRGTDNTGVDENSRQTTRNLNQADEDDLIMVIYGYQRLIDPEDGSEGIYLTIFNPSAVDVNGVPVAAKRELLNGHDDYPFVTTRISHDQQRLYETQNISNKIRGAQWQIKTERDSRIDRASLSTLPPIMHPSGRPPSDWGPGRYVPYRRLGEIAFGPTPPSDNNSLEIEQAMQEQADKAVGLGDSQLGMIRKQFYVNKYLSHVQGVLSMAWKLFQRLGPDEVFFVVTGNPNPQTMTKGDPNEDFNITVAFDSMSTDPETAELRVKQMSSLMMFDRNGRIDPDKLLEFSAMAIDPILADYVLTSQEESQQKVSKEVTDDLAKIFAGIETAARPNGAQVALQIVQEYASQEDVSARLQQDEAFAARLSKYAEQYQFQLQQAQNAEIGRIGTAPAQMGGVQTQNMEQ